MTLSGREGAMELLKRIREIIGEVSRDPQYGTDGSSMLTEVERLEFTIRNLTEKAARPETTSVDFAVRGKLSARSFSTSIIWLRRKFRNIGTDGWGLYQLQ